MKFSVDGVQYFLDFKREYKMVPSGYDKVAKAQIMKESKYPYTTANLWKQEAGKLPGIYRSATVGAYRGDRYTNERGRVIALRALTKGMDLFMRQAVWTAYSHRDRTGGLKPCHTCKGVGRLNRNGSPIK